MQFLQYKNACSFMDDWPILIKIVVKVQKFKENSIFCEKLHILMEFPENKYVVFGHSPYVGRY